MSRINLCCLWGEKPQNTEKWTSEVAGRPGWTQSSPSATWLLGLLHIHVCHLILHCSTEGPVRSRWCFQSSTFEWRAWMHQDLPDEMYKAPTKPGPRIALLQLIAKHWHRLPRGCEVSSSEMFRSCLDMGLGPLLWVSLLEQWVSPGPRGPCQPQPTCGTTQNESL